LELHILQQSSSGRDTKVPVVVIMLCDAVVVLCDAVTVLCVVTVMTLCDAVTVLSLLKLHVLRGTIEVNLAQVCIEAKSLRLKAEGKRGREQQRAEMI
jgi:hypothetical protein